MHLNFNRVGGRYCKGLAKISKDFFAPLQTVSLPITIRDFKLIFLELETSQVWLRIKALKIECDLKF